MIRIAKGRSVEELIAVLNRSTVADVPKATATMRQCWHLSATVWIGWVDDEPACAWGLIPPTILSEQAYLWLLTNDLVEDHKFLFIRHSQRFIEIMLREYPTIVGHVIAGQDKSIRWLRWLGAKFNEPQGSTIPFQIKAANG